MLAMRNPMMMWVLIGAVCAAGPAAAETKTWIGGEGRWEDAANWNPLGEPGATSQVQINAGTNYVEVGLTEDRNHEVLSIRTESVGDGQVNIGRWGGGWTGLQAANGLLNLGNLELEEVDLTGNVVNHAFLEMYHTEATWPFTRTWARSPTRARFRTRRARACT